MAIPKKRLTGSPEKFIAAVKLACLSRMAFPTEESALEWIVRGVLFE